MLRLEGDILFLIIILPRILAPRCRLCADAWGLSPPPDALGTVQRVPPRPVTGRSPHLRPPSLAPAHRPSLRTLCGRREGAICPERSPLQSPWPSRPSPPPFAAAIQALAATTISSPAPHSIPAARTLSCSSSPPHDPPTPSIRAGSRLARTPAGAPSFCMSSSSPSFAESAGAILIAIGSSADSAPPPLTSPIRPAECLLLGVGRSPFLGNSSTPLLSPSALGTTIALPRFEPYHVGPDVGACIRAESHAVCVGSNVRSNVRARIVVRSSPHDVRSRVGTGRQ